MNMCCVRPMSRRFDGPVRLYIRFKAPFPQSSAPPGSAPSMSTFKNESGVGGMKTKRRYMAKNDIFRSKGFADWFVRLDRFKNSRF